MKAICRDVVIKFIYFNLVLIFLILLMLKSPFQARSIKCINFNGLFYPKASESLVFDAMPRNVAVPEFKSIFINNKRIRLSSSKKCKHSWDRMNHITGSNQGTDLELYFFDFLRALF